MRKCLLITFVLLTTFLAQQAFAATVSFDFDDGRASPNVSVIPYLNSRGYKVTLCPHLAEVGTPGHLTVADYINLVRNGNVVCNHTISHLGLPGKSSVILEREVLEAQVVIESFANAVSFSLENRSVINAATPQGLGNSTGSDDPVVIEMFKRAGIIFLRGTDGEANCPATFDPYRIKSVSVGQGTDATMEFVLRLFDEAVACDGNVTIVLHRVINSADSTNVDQDSDNTYAVTDTFVFQLVEAALQRGMEIVPLKEAGFLLLKQQEDLAAVARDLPPLPEGTPPPR